MIPRIGTAITFYGTAALRQLECWGAIRSMSRSPLPGRVTNCVPCNCWRVRASTCLSRALRIRRMIPAI
ncbi:hypothetical protein ACLBOM_24325 [Escherichia coli]